MIFRDFCLFYCVIIEIFVDFLNFLDLLRLFLCSREFTCPLASSDTIFPRGGWGGGGKENILLSDDVDIVSSKGNLM